MIDETATIPDTSTSGEPGQQGRRGQSEARVAPERRYLAQREQHERPSVHLRVGQLQLAAAPPSARVADLPAAEVEDIDIQLPRPPVAPKPAASPTFDAFEGSEQSGRGNASLDHHD
jgi:hypothetical protein